MPVTLSNNTLVLVRRNAAVDDISVHMHMPHVRRVVNVLSGRKAFVVMLQGTAVITAAMRL